MFEPVAWTDVSRIAAGRLTHVLITAAPSTGRVVHHGESHVKRCSRHLWYVISVIILSLAMI